jgi:hypothetical protein
LREHLQMLEVRLREDQDREGYLRQPPTVDAFHKWEAEASWPPE